jgi:hypothetical protein
VSERGDEGDREQSDHGEVRRGGKSVEEHKPWILGPLLSSLWFGGHARHAI